MTEYLIVDSGSSIPSTYTWNEIVSLSPPPLSGDTIKLTENISFGTSTNATNRITLQVGVTFDGQGYVVTLVSKDHTGLFNLPAFGGTCNIQNLGVDCNNHTMLSQTGYIVYGNVSGVQINGNLYNCYVRNGNMTTVSQGGLVGRVGGNTQLNIYRCRYSGNVYRYGGGIMTLPTNNFNGTVNIKECYTEVDFTNTSSAGGILGPVYSASGGTINIFNCYNVTNSSTGNDVAGIHSIINSSEHQSPSVEINIKSCYSIGAKFIYTDRNTYTETIHVTNSYGEPSELITRDGTTNLINSTSTITNSSASLTEIQGQLPTEWTTNEYTESNTWTAGSDLNYPTLDQFTLGPWTSYSIYTDEAFLTENYTGGNERGSGGGGGGDPHIFPLFGKTYDLPHSEETFLLLDNQQEDNNDRLIVKGKCWYVPRHIYENDVDNYVKDGVSKLEYMDFYEKKILTFFKYLKVQYGGEVYIFDMDSLKIKEYTNYVDLKNGTLPTKKRCKKCDSITITKPMKRYQLLFSKNVTRESKFKHSQNAMAREIIIKTKNNKVVLLLISDPQIVDLRNSIELIISSNAKSFSGALIREEIKIVDF